MGTPMRLLLSPKLLSPKSPVALGKFLENKPNERLTEGLQRFNFVSTQELPNADLKRTRPDIQIKITDFSCKSKSLIVKTPEKFEILENGIGENDFNILGRGAFGTVVTGEYKNNNVAVKIIKLRPNEELREAKVLRLEHENIVKTIDVIINANMNYAIVIMEYINSIGHLQNILDDEDFMIDKKLIVKYAVDITKGIDFCHQNSLVHMDLKPANILVCEDNLCKICDFGNCYNVETDSSKPYQHRGTISYTAPEILLGKEPSKECDIYSLGITLWQMITRRMPYGDIQVYEVIVYKVVKFDLRPDTNFQNTDSFLRSLYIKCWSANPRHRPNCSEILQHLRTVLLI